MNRIIHTLMKRIIHRITDTIIHRIIVFHRIIHRITVTQNAESIREAKILDGKIWCTRESQ